MDTIDRNLKKSEYIVRGMSSTFGFIKNLFKNPKKFDKKASPQLPQEEQKEHVIVEQPITAKQ